MITGILLGLGAATSQSFSYLCTKTFVHKHRKGHLPLLAISHIIMAAISAVVLLFIWPENMLPFKEYAWTLTLTALFYLIGQGCLFQALHHTDPSRIAPLLGIKVLLLAVISVTFMSQYISPLQWLAVIMCVFAAVMLGWSGGWIPLKSAIWVLAACTSYCCSDINVKIFVEHFADLPLAHAAALAASLCYTLCGIFGLCVLVFLPKPTPKMWLEASPFAITWLGSMFLLFSCFGVIGVVHGNIIQSSRGVISILIGLAIAAAGHVHLETKISKTTLLRRITAAIIMTAAIAIFSAQQGK